MNKFWNWIRNDAGVRILRMEGPIDEESLWGDEVTPKAFRDELNAEEGDIILWLNSPGGNVFAASEIYTMLKDYKGKVTVKIDSVAASAASVIAMAGDHVAMSPTALLMIHDPSTIAFGNAKDMEHAIEVLNEVKDSIINAYMTKSHLSHNRIATLMSNETWMNAKKAYDLGFVDEILFKDAEPPKEEPEEDETESEGEAGENGEEEEKKPFQLKAQQLEGHLYSTRQMGLTILNRLGVDTTKPKEPPTPAEPTKPTDQIPIIGLDGKTADGSMPYQILMKQLECLQ